MIMATLANTPDKINARLGLTDQFGLNGKGFAFWTSLMITPILVLVVWAYTAQASDCKARGGELVQTGSQVITTMVNNVPVTTNMPIYSCFAQGVIID